MTQHALQRQRERERDREGDTEKERGGWLETGPNRDGVLMFPSKSFYMNHRVLNWKGRMEMPNFDLIPVILPKSFFCTTDTGRFFVDKEIMR